MTAPMRVCKATHALAADPLCTRLHAIMQILDYSVQQYRLLPLLAATYGLHFTGVYMQGLFNKLKVREGDRGGQGGRRCAQRGLTEGGRGNGACARGSLE